MIVNLVLGVTGVGYVIAGAIYDEKGKHYT
jgi:hypothetical protein